MKKYILLLFVLFIFTTTSVAASNEELNMASGVVPHHLLAKEIIEDFFSYIARQKYPETIIILSPDHFHSAVINDENSFITVELESGKEEFSRIKVYYHLLKELAANNKMSLNNSAVVSEFGITNLLPFIRKYFPEVKILPILIPDDISKEQVSRLVNTIDKISSAYTIVIASVDFSHYLPIQAAELHDIKSIRVLLNFEEENFKNIEVDSWQCLYAARLFAKLKQKENPLIIAYKNSVHFLKLDLEETTSYFSAIFESEESTKYSSDISINNFNKNKETILLVGDVMLDRGVERLINQNSVYYPFRKINQFLRGTDIVFGNLEGPVMENPPEFPDSSLKFAFNQKVLEGARVSNFNLFSLANNHTMDMGKEGLEETQDWLKKYQINSVGNPFLDNSDYRDFSFSTEHTVFMTFNQIFPFINNPEEIIKKVEAAKSINLEKFLIVSIHWGKEYQNTSSLIQQELAYKIIEAGADLIAGHHPHVVQEIEIYRGKIIFYSLGNFIFDRHFFPETREGLAVGLEIYPDRITCRLFPLQINLCQPSLMNQGEEKEFLQKLAQRSDKKITNEIYNGIIEVKRQDKTN